MTAMMAINAIPPAITSLGLWSRMRIARPRSTSTFTRALDVRRRGMSSSSLISFLGTFLHLDSWLRNCVPRWRRQRCNVARGWRGLGREWQPHRNSGPLIDLALYNHFTAMQGNQSFHNRKPEARALVPPLIGLACLKERIADPFEVLGGDADSRVGDTDDQTRCLDACGYRHSASALGELDAIGNQIEHDLLECTGIADHDRQI